MKLRLAAEGFCGGDPEKIGKMSGDWVFKTFAYLNFKSEYEEVFIEINREK